jgi:beta-glucosidase
LQDNPAYINYPGENGKVYYGEGLFVGYRYYDKKEVAPLFPFGHGLSYTQFAYSNLRVSEAAFSAESTLTVECDITNTGTRTGKEIVQLYVHDQQSTLVRPEKELKAFAKVSLEPGETKTVAFDLDRQAFWYYNPAHGGWTTEPGAFDILIGASSRDLRLQTTVRLIASDSDQLHSGMTVRQLIADPHGKAVLERHFAGMIGMVESFGALDYSLEQLAKMAPDPDMLTPEKLAEINADLARDDDTFKGFADVFPGEN